MKLLANIIVMVCVVVTLLVALLLVPRVFGADPSSIGALPATALAVQPGAGSSVHAPTTMGAGIGPGLRAQAAPTSSFRWRTSLASFYDFNTWGYGRPGGRSGHFACGGRYLRSTIAVAHRTLPCGTIVRFCHNKVCLNVPVRDRFGGSGFDLTSEAAIRLNHVFTGPIQWRVVR
jgi:hypothetical protein